ncbi:MAG: NAD(P)/FAD-dependent oxidoreductase, partial [Candidatus Hodarchaeales archaeon]
MYDICVIGAGITGCSIARELARYENLNVLVKFNLLGNPMFAKLTKDLAVPFKQNGTYVVSLTDEGIKELEVQQKKGEKNNVPTEILLDKEKIFKLEPGLSKETTGILIAPTGGVVSPYELTIGLAENAYDNKVEFKFNFAVSDIVNHGDSFTITSDKKESIKSRGVINA